MRMNMLQNLNRRQAGSLLALSLGLGLAGCATPPRPPQPDVPASTWNGRLSLTLDREPPQSFFASFQLRGTPREGTLDLYNPLGSTIAQVRWNPSEAMAQQGKMAREYPSLDDLIIDLTGANVPVAALFDWLAGRNTQVAGWLADLSRQREGRISARRLQPLPTAQLQIVLDR